MIKGRKIKNLRQEGWRLAKFGALGGLTTLSHLAIALVALEKFAWHPILANLFAFLFAFVISFLGHYYFTFSDLRGKLLPAMRIFLLIAFGGFLVNNALLVWLLSERWLGDAQAIIISVLVVPLATFLAARFWAFRAS